MEFNLPDSMRLKVKGTRDYDAEKITIQLKWGKGGAGESGADIVIS